LVSSKLPISPVGLPYSSLFYREKFQKMLSFSAEDRAIPVAFCSFVGSPLSRGSFFLFKINDLFFPMEKVTVPSFSLAWTDSLA